MFERAILSQPKSGDFCFGTIGEYSSGGDSKIGTVALDDAFRGCDRHGLTRLGLTNIDAIPSEDRPGVLPPTGIQFEARTG